MPYAGDCFVGIGESVAGCAGFIRTFQDAHFICKIIFCEGQHTADSGCPVRCIGFKFSGFQCILKGFARNNKITDGICLVAVCHNQLAIQLTDGCVDNQRRVFHLGCIEGINHNILALLLEDAVAAVIAAPHDEISHCRLCAILCFADDNAATHIAVILYQVLHGILFIYIHAFYCPFCSLAATISTAFGRRIHSACSMTLLCSTSGVSPSSISTAFCKMISPPSGISFT